MANQDDLLLPEEEIINLVTEYHHSGVQNRHVLAKNVAKAQLAHCEPLIEARERGKISQIIEDYDTWTEEEGGEEKFREKYGKGTIDLIAVIEEALKGG